MFRKRYRQQIPELNTTSTADISFMLLIFFLVTSSMDTDKGLLRQLAPPPVENQQPQDVNKVSLEELQQAVIAMAQVNRMGHVVSVQADRETTYEAYFRMQDAIVGAYHQLRDRYANEHFGRPYHQLSAEDRATVNEYYPQRISEGRSEN